MRILRPWLTEDRVITSTLTSWWIALFFLLFLQAESLFAQIDPNSDPTNNYCVNPKGALQGGFTLENNRICVGGTVKVKNGSVPAALKNVGYIREYDGKGIPVTIELGPSFQYTKPGSYTILQVGTINGTGALACQTITVLPLDAISFKAQACLGRRATITVDQSTLGQYDSYNIRWGDGVVDNVSRASLIASPAHTYNASATSSPTITVEGVYGSAASPLCNGNPTTQSVSLLAAATQPVITALTTTGDNSIELKYQASTGLTVQLYQKINGVYTATGQQGTGAGTFTVQTDAKQVQCFQLVPQDACNSQTAKSDEVCSLVLDVKAANKQNNLSWQPYAGTATQFRYYRIYRNNAPTGGTITTRTINTYADANAITCGVQYCYSLETTSGPTVVTSARICVNGVNGDAPGDVTSAVVSVEDGRPRLITTPPANIGPTDSFTMVVSRASGPSGSFQPIATLERTSSYTDESANTNTDSYCYQVVYQNSCGLQSKPSSPVCTVLLGAKTTTGIDWNTESPFTPETVDSYTVEVIDSLNGTKREIQVGGNTHYEPDPNDPNLQSQKYRIIAVSNGGTISYSNFYTFRREARILVPDAFTPNGDGMNDEFIAKGVYVDRFSMNIYSRWGEVVYSTTNKSQGWDGKINGQNAEPGQYMYRIEVIDLTGLKTVRTGALLLIR